MPTRLQDDRFRRLLRKSVVLLPIYFAVLAMLLYLVAQNVRTAIAGAAAMSALAVVAGAVHAWGIYSARLVRSRLLRALLTLWGLIPGLAAVILLLVFGMGPAVTIVVGLAVAVVGSAAYRPMLRRVRQDQLFGPVVPESLSDAELIRLASARPVYRRGIDPYRYVVARINYARALIMLAMRESDYDRVTEALPILRQVIEDARLMPALALDAADDLVNAESTLAERSRDGRRYAQAVDLYARLVTEVGANAVQRARLHYHRAGYDLFVLRGASEEFETVGPADSDAARRTTVRAAAAYEGLLRNSHAAIDLVPHGTDAHAEYLMALGNALVVASAVQEDTSDEGIALIRQSLAMRTPYRRSRRNYGRLMLAGCLLMRVDLRIADPARREELLAALAEIEQIAWALVKAGDLYEVRARWLLAEVAVRRDRLR
ncbi:hypothetical protein [Dactylosporangium sp. CA-092794]|uniref:hypothetical protein n=1 Tax=Dactylosporangium sp. CA-092794 TaxID=3239929 RepID=UPI003D8B5CAD